MKFEIRDAALIRNIERAAIKKGCKDVMTFGNELFVRAARIALGMNKDLSPSEVAAQLDCHINTVGNYHKRGKFPHAYYRTRGCLRIPQKDVDALKRL